MTAANDKPKMERAWLWVKTEDNKAVEVADAIWTKHKGKQLKHTKLETAWVVRADVLDHKTIVVPVVGKLKEEGTPGPIAVIVEEIRKHSSVKDVVPHKVTNHFPGDPDKGNHKPPKEPKKDRPLNGWG